MRGTQVEAIRRRNAGRPPVQNPRRRVVLTVSKGQRGKALDDLLTGEEVLGFRDRAKFLGISPAALHRAFNGEPVSAELVAGVMAAFPGVAYKHLFTEVTDDAATQPEAA